MTRADRIWLRLMEAGQSLGCHQKPERSFFLWGYQFPVCARCTGVMVGQIAATAAILKGIRIRPCLIVPMLALMGGDWLLQRAGIRPSTNPRRLITGILGGLGLSTIYFYGLLFLLKTGLNIVRKKQG